MEFRDYIVQLRVSKMLTVPRSIEYRPITDAKTYVIFLELSSIANTGTTGENRTISPILI